MWPYDLLTLEAWDALPKPTSHRFEVMEGLLVVVPAPPPAHQAAAARLASRLDVVLGPDAVVVRGVEVLVDPVFPTTVRVPDVAVTRRLPAQGDPARVDAVEVLLAVEISSPGANGTDRIVKPAEYADAGIPHYWHVDVDGPVTLTAFSLVAGRYKQIAQGTGKVEVPEPFPVTIDLTTLINP